MQKKAKRFVYKADGTPGPTAYDPKIRSKKCVKLDPRPIPGKGRLYVCRVPYSIKFTQTHLTFVKVKL